MRSRVTFTGRFFSELLHRTAAAPAGCSMRPEYLVAAADRAGKKSRAEGQTRVADGAGKSAARGGCRVARVALEIY